MLDRIDLTDVRISTGKGYENRGFLQESSGENSLCVPAVHPGLVGSQLCSGPKHEFSDGMGTRCSNETEERHRKIGCTGTTGRLPDHL